VVLIIGLILAALWLAAPLLQSASSGVALGMSDRMPASEDAEDGFVYLPLVMKSYPFTLAAPVLQSINNPDGLASYTVSWSASDGAASYTLQEASAADFANPGTAYTGAATSVDISDRFTGTYYYRVRASSSNSESDWSNIESVEVTVASGCPATGMWSGVTSQGGDSEIGFEVQDTPYCRIPESDLLAGKLGIALSFWDSCGEERNIANLDEIPIVDGSINLDHSTGYIRGQFTSFTTAIGTFFYTNAGCTATGTWNAELPPPGAFGKVSPADGAVVHPPDLTLDWSTSSQAERYEVCYDTTDDDACTNWVSTGTTSQASISGLEPSPTYYWQVRAVSVVGTTYANGDAAAYWSFTTSSGLPDSFSKLSPVDGATNLFPGSLTLDWGASSRAETYDYCYDTTDDNACTGWISSGATTQAVITGLDATTTYYWQVRAANSYGVTYADGTEAAYWAFTTSSGLPGSFAKLSPADGATGRVTTDLTLDWGNSSYVESYAYCYDTTDDDACLDWVSAGATSQAVISGLEDLTTYYWQVRASNSYGATYANGADTAYWSFTTQSELTGTWTELTPGAEWSGRYGHSSVVLPGGSIVLMGGYDGAYRNDVWISTDQGATWEQQTAAAEWSARRMHASVVLPGGDIVLIGGYDGAFHNDVWISTDQGATWTQQTAAAEWSARSFHTLVVLPDDSLLLMGGASSSGTLWNDVWRSTNQGANWTLMVNHAEWGARGNHQSVVLADGSVVLMGGFGFEGTSVGRRRDVWRSTNQGATWVLMNASAPWAAREAHISVVIPDGSIILMGGYAGDYRNDMWRSKDYGATWVQLATASWSARSSRGVVLPDGSIVVMGGASDSGNLNDVWRFVQD